MKTENEERPKQDIIEFLCGAGTYDGYWWGQTPKDKRPPYWWRRNLRDYVEGVQSRVSDLDRENKRLKENQGKQNIAILNHLCDKTALKAEKERLEKEVEELRATIYDLRKHDVRLPLD